MKIQQLTIHNIASIEHAVIDFTAEPLASSEVFLITGHTGAGKSTILDSICLALYGEVPRLSNAKGGTNRDNNDITVKDVRQLMRRNTGEAYAELLFTGSNGIAYKALWGVARARNKATGRLQAKRWELTNVDSGTTLTKDKEVRAEIQDAVGLDFSQFCRTTMLAQGEFTRFLNSDDNEKAAILEKITGQDMYSRIGAKVYEMTTAKKEAHDEAQRRIEGIKVLSDEEIASLQDEIQEINDKDTAFSQLDLKLTAMRNWLKTKAELDDKAAKATEAHNDAQQALLTGEFKTNERTVTLWNDTIEQRQLLKNLTEAKELIERQNNVIKGYKHTFASFCAGQQWQTAETQRTSKELENVETSIKAQDDKAQVYGNSQTIDGHLKSMVAGRRKIADEHKKTTGLETKLNGELKEALAQAIEQEILAKGNLDGQDKAVKRLDDEYAAMNVDAINTSLERSRDRVSTIETAQRKIAELAQAQQRYDKNARDMATKLVYLNKAKETAAQLEAAVNEARIKKESKEDTLNKLSATVADWAKEMRRTLKAGDTCPVCGQAIEQELPREEVLDAVLASAEKDYKAAKAAHEALLGEKNELDAEIKVKADDYAGKKQEHDLDTSVADARNAALESCQALGIEEIGDETASALSDLKAEADAERDKLHQQQRLAAELSKKISDERSKVETLRNKHDSAKDAVTKAQNEIKDCKNDISTAQSLIKSNQHDVDEAISQVAALLAHTQWHNDWQEQTDAFRTELKDAAKAYSDAVTKQRQLAHTLETMSTLNGNIAASMNALLDVMPQWNKIEATATAPACVPDILNQLSSLRSDVKSARDSITTATTTVTSATQELEAFYIAHEDISADVLAQLNGITPQRIRQLDEKVKQCREAFIKAETNLKTAMENQLQHDSAKPEINDNDTVDSLAQAIDDNNAVRKALSERKGAITGELDTDRRNKQQQQELINDKNEKHAEWVKWERLNTLLGSSSGDKFRKIAQSFVLQSLIHAANRYMAKLNHRYSLTVDPGSFVIYVEDSYQGFQRRVASTISGGESFLVSLSLALALSDMGHQLAVDTLFIDEGFGTLSGEPLHRAVDTLRDLHSHTGRHVGIISHIEELRERIPVQIKVEQTGNSSSSTITVA
ncbi:MAG: AAA family ATPase [Muribaculaceae bacterium]|nr:AAA family ATPase [Muribaculaceae bacterium]